jgi:multiple sugar transport system ATP-binding protein
VATVALKDVSKTFPDGTVAVDGVSLEINDGEFMVLLGPSGCGKSTVLRMVAGLEAPSSGTVLLNGEAADELTPRDRQIAMVFQDFALYPHMTVGENVAFPLRMAGVTPDAIEDQVSEVLSALGITELRGRKPAQLSGGQRQRVAMGRAIVRRPQLFLMDEPLSNLDSGLRSELRAEISDLVRNLGVTTMYVTHDQTEALTMADRIAIMRRGVLQDVGTPAEVYGRPATLYVAAFLGSPRMNLIEASVRVSLDRHVALHIGGQALYMPWHDIRARAISHYHGERVVLGLRAEALAPVPTTQASSEGGDNILRGSIRYVEHHGHESLAFLDIGATAVAVDDLWSLADAEVELASPRRRVSAMLRQLAGRGTTPAGAGAGGGTRARAGVRQRGGTVGAADETSTKAQSVFGEAGRRHRRPAEFVVRLAPYPGGTAGQQIAVAVRLDLAHFFDEHGNRIDVGWR